MTFTASIEPRPATDARIYRTACFQHGFHLGTQETMARYMVETLFIQYNSGRDPRTPHGVITVGLVEDGRFVDVFDGKDWESALALPDDDFVWDDNSEEERATRNLNDM